MKMFVSRLPFLLSFLMLTGLINQSCIRDTCNMTYSFMEYTPVYMTAEEFRNAATVTAPRDLKHPGKILVQGDYLFVNEIAKGVHIFDNRNPEAPVALAFINAPGNYDLAVNCGKLYLDSSTDLLVFDLSDPSNPRLEQRVENALPHIIYYRGYEADPEKGIVVEWIGERKEQDFNCREDELPEFVRINRVQMEPLMGNTPNTINNASTTGRGVNPAVPGKAGSMSRFAVNGEYLYVITPSELRVYDASSCTQPVYTHSVAVELWGGEAETVFIYGDLVLIGATNGMFIYNGSNPAQPFMLSRFDHMTGCDPVVAENDMAYVTLRSSQQTNCPGWTNQLEVIDISIPSQPTQVRVYPMTGPQGLGIQDGILYLCDGDAGLKIFDASDPTRITDNQLAHFPELNAYDAIPHGEVLVMVGNDGLAQYDISNPGSVNLLSTIPVVQ